jgi:hypothetical protein
MEFTMKRILLLAFVFTTQVLYAQWSTDPSINNAICTNYYGQNEIKMISDGNGGVIICWNDKRNGLNGIFNDEVYAQRIGSNGNILWTIDGIKVTPSNVYRYTNSMCSDGNGGAFISWHAIVDSNSLCIQHINASGTLMWDSSGITICSTTLSDQLLAKIVSDGNGGAIIAWGDTRNNIGVHDDDVYAQRVNAAGVVQWTANGMAVSNASGSQGASLQITSDGGGGAIMIWEDNRCGAVEIYTQKINASGAVLWDTTGVLVNSVVGGSLYPQLISDAGGAIICWVDRRNGNTDWNIYAQKVSTSGSVQWTVNGEAICLASSNQTSPQLASDGNGGAIITWDEPVSATNTNPNIYAQRVNVSGVAEWVTNGVGVCLAANGQRFPQLSSDGNGGAVITWQDARTNNIQDVYAQRINSSGSSLWTNDGVAVSTATFVQSFPIVLNDGNNGMIIAWTDLRNDLTGQRHDIYAQRVNSDGTLGGVTDVNESVNLQLLDFSLDQNYPNPFNPSTTIKFSIPNEEFVSLKVFNSLGEEVAELLNETKPAGNYSVSFNASSLTSGVYFYKISAGNFIETKKMILIK